MFERLIKVAVDTVTLPVAVAADVVTLGGALMDRDEPYTVSKAKRLGKEVGNVVKVIVE